MIAKRRTPPYNNSRNFSQSFIDIALEPKSYDPKFVIDECARYNNGDTLTSLVHLVPLILVTNFLQFSVVGRDVDFVWKINASFKFSKK